MVAAKVRGRFSRWAGALAVPDGGFTRATVEVTVDATSIDIEAGGVLAGETVEIEIELEAVRQGRHRRGL